LAIDDGSLLHLPGLPLDLLQHNSAEKMWMVEGTDIDGRRITAIVVAYEDEEYPEIKIITTWANKPK
jgi:hypothetical protein